MTLSPRPIPRSATTTRAVWLRRLAALAVLLMLLVVASSAWIRLAQARPACSDWPACRQPVSTPGFIASTDGASAADLAGTRGLHRGAASLLLPVAAVVVGLAWVWSAARAWALLLLALGVALALLGVITPGSRAPAVLLGNQLGGWLMLAVAWRLATHEPGPGTAARHQRPAVAPQLSTLAAALWLVQAAVGSLSGQMAPSVAAAGHLLMATALWPLTLWCTWHARRGPRPGAARALLLLVLLQGASGLWAAAGAASPERVWWHAVLGAVGFALLANLHATARTDTRT
jgi:heme A synthase